MSMISSLHTHTKLKAELTIQCKINIAPCAVQIHNAWGGDIPVHVLEMLINELRSVSPDLVPLTGGGVATSNVTNNSQAAPIADALATILLG